MPVACVSHDAPAVLLTAQHSAGHSCVDVDTSGGHSRQDDAVMIVVTERLGRPRTILGDIVQTKSVYPIDSDTPTALCHLLPAPDLPALCGHPWEALVEVPNAVGFEDVPEDLRCRECLRAGAVA